MDIILNNFNKRYNCNCVLLAMFLLPVKEKLEVPELNEKISVKVCVIMGSVRWARRCGGGSGGPRSHHLGRTHTEVLTRQVVEFAFAGLKAVVDDEDDGSILPRENLTVVNAQYKIDSNTSCHIAYTTIMTT